LELEINNHRWGKEKHKNRHEPLIKEAIEGANNGTRFCFNQELSLDQNNKTKKAVDSHD